MGFLYTQKNYSQKDYTSKTFNQKDFLHPISRDYVNKFIAAGVRIPPDLANIDQFVKQLSLLINPSFWCCFPLRSQHNAGSGTTAFSLGGLSGYSGTLINGPTWGTNGIRFSAANQTINTNYQGNASMDYTLMCDFNTETGFVATGIAMWIGNNKGAAFTATSTPRLRLIMWDGVSAANISTDSSTNTSTACVGIVTGESTRGMGSGNGTIYQVVNGDYRIRPNTPGSLQFNTSIEQCTVRFGLVIQGVAFNHQTIYNLYKNTIGQGLSLP